MFSGSTNIEIYLGYEHVVMCLKVCLWGILYWPVVNGVLQVIL